MTEQEIGGCKIGWKDSTSAPSRIHRTEDGGTTTVCGHRPSAKWTLTQVPSRGGGRYCRICFAEGGKKLPWLDNLTEEPCCGPYRPGELFA